MKLEIKGIEKYFGKRQILRGIDFTAESGQCVAILGKNGSGKSTLLSILAGVQRRDGGEFWLDGRDLFRDKAYHASCVGYVPQGTPLLEELTARDNLRLWYDRASLTQALAGGVLEMLGVKEFLNVTVSKLSGGMKKRLSIGCSMAKAPSVLLLDEPCAALDLVCKQSIFAYLEEFKRGGGTVLLTTHDESELALCDRVFILRDGMLTPYDYDGDVARLTKELL